MKTTIELNEKTFKAISIVFGALLLIGLTCALCMGNVSNLSTIGY